MVENENINANKTLIDIIDADILIIRAIHYWSQLKKEKKKQKGFVYNRVINRKWGVEEKLNWIDDYHNLNEIQRRLLLKRELINAYNSLSVEDRHLLHQYLDIDSNSTKWYNLKQDEKKKILKGVFKFF